MPEVQNIRAEDYAQYQPSQYQQEAFSEAYDTQPEVYDESYEQMQAANKSRLGATILSTAIVAGVGIASYFIGKNRGAKAAPENMKKELEAVKKELDELKNSEAVKNYDKLKEAANEISEIANGDKVYSKGWINGAKNFINKIKELLKSFVTKVKKAIGGTKEDTTKKA